MTTPQFAPNERAIWRWHRRGGGYDDVAVTVVRDTGTRGVLVRFRYRGESVLRHALREHMRADYGRCADCGDVIEERDAYCIADERLCARCAPEVVQ